MCKQGSRWIALLFAMLLVVPGQIQAVGLGRVTASCSVTTTAVAFGSYIGQAVSSTGTVRVTCSAPVAGVQVKFDAGLNSTGSFSARKLKSLSGQTLRYNLYTDVAHTKIWGDGTTGTYTQQGQILTIYGQLAGGQVTIPGTYNDTVLVTIIW